MIQISKETFLKPFYDSQDYNFFLLSEEEQLLLFDIYFQGILDGGLVEVDKIDYNKPYVI